jgi:hypothetical protein
VVIDDRRLAEASYPFALAGGVADRVICLNLPDETDPAMPSSPHRCPKPETRSVSESAV